MEGAAATMVAMECSGVNVHERARLAGQRLWWPATVSPDGIVGDPPVTDFVRVDEMIVIDGMRTGATKSLRTLAAGSQLAFVGVVDTTDCWDSRIHIHPDWVASFDLADWARR